MAIVIMMMALLLSITGAALLFSGLNLKTTSNLKTGNLALQIADAGIQHALAVIPVWTDFDTLLQGSASAFPCKPSSPCDGVTNKPTLTGSLSGYTYTVVAANDTTVPGETATNDTNKIVILTSTAISTNGATRSIKAYVGRSSSTWNPPGAIYLPGQPQYIETRFNGNSFQISGRDSNPGQGEGSGSASPIVGISATASGTTSEITGASGSLAGSQYGQVIGQGSSPSVGTTTSTLDVNQLAQDLISAGIELVDRQTLSGGNYSSGQWGTSLIPKITHITGDATLTGTLAGWGVLIVDGNMTIRGSFTFNGLVIGRGDVDVNGSGGEGATVWGTLLIKESTSADAGDELVVGGNGKILYSSQTINTALSHWGTAFPQPVKLIAWHEVMQ